MLIYYQGVWSIPCKESLLLLIKLVDPPELQLPTDGIVSITLFEQFRLSIPIKLYGEYQIPNTEMVTLMR